MNPSPSSALVSDALVGIAERWLTEQRRARRWAGIWRGVVAFYFGLFLALYLARVGTACGSPAARTQPW